MSISAAQVKELREKTGCPMMDCKKALVDAGGDQEAAVELLRKRGHDSAAKRRDRATSEGAIGAFADPEGRRAAIVELLCETDFVGRNADFTALANDLARGLAHLDEDPRDAGAFLDAPLEGGETAGARMGAVQTTLKENIRLGRLQRLAAAEDERVDVYLHFNGKVASAVRLGFSSASLREKPPVLELIRDLCMQVAFTGPLGIKREDVPPEIVEKERATLADLDEVKQKPEKVRPKIVEGKLTRFFKETVLLEQEFVKEKKTPVKTVLQNVGKEAGGVIDVREAVRFEVGTSPGC